MENKLTKITISISALGPAGSRKSTAIKKLLIAIEALVGNQLEVLHQDVRRLTLTSKMTGDSTCWEESVTKEGQFSIQEIENWNVKPLLSSIL